MTALAESNPAAAAAAAAVANIPMPPAPKAGSSTKRKGGASKVAPPTEDTTMTDATDEPPGPTSYPPDGSILPVYQRPPPTAHASDSDALLTSRVPPFPSDDELRALMTAPPLSWNEARGSWAEADAEDRAPQESRYPLRRFCEVCGYWGRVRCVKCGARVCALDCLDVHREDCITRYGH